MASGSSKFNEKWIPSYKRIIDKYNIVLLVEAGSHLIGMDTKDSDYDQIGVFIDDMKNVAGFGSLETDTYRSAQERTNDSTAKSEAGDIEVTLYGLRKFLRLAIGGNPNILSLLYAPDNKCIIQSVTGRSLQTLRSNIVSNKAADAYLGYLNAQRLRLMGSRGQRGVNRDGLEQEFGYDVKYAAHMVRLGYESEQLFRDGYLTYPLGSDYLDMLKSIRSGRYSLDECLATAERSERNIRHYLNTHTWFPEAPDFEAIEKWLLDVYTNSWKL